MGYSSKQKEYIDSVNGEAHNSAVEIIGQLQAKNERLRELLLRILKGIPIATLDNLCLFVKFREKLEEEFGEDFIEQALKGE